MVNNQPPQNQPVRFDRRDEFEKEALPLLTAFIDVCDRLDIPIIVTGCIARVANNDIHFTQVLGSDTYISNHLFGLQNLLLDIVSNAKILDVTGCPDDLPQQANAIINPASSQSDAAASPD